MASDALTPVASGQFKRDVKRAAKRGCDMEKLKVAVKLLLSGNQLSPAYRDHALKGKWHGFRDLHLEPDWLLLYKIAGNQLLLARTGSHSDLFE